MQPHNKRELMVAIVQLGINEYDMFNARMGSANASILDSINNYGLQAVCIDLALSLGEIVQLYMLGHNSRIPSNARMLTKQYLKSLETTDAE